jgi:hypothetical protein
MLRKYSSISALAVCCGTARFTKPPIAFWEARQDFLRAIVNEIGREAAIFFWSEKLSPLRVVLCTSS